MGGQRNFCGVCRGVSSTIAYIILHSVNLIVACLCYQRVYQQW